MSVGEVAGLIAAVAFVLLVGVLAFPLVKLGGVFDETRSMIKGVSDETVPLLSEVTTTVTTTNAQLVRVDAITSNVQAVTTNVSALTALLAATLGGPVVKVAAFTYGVRSALADRPGSRTRRKVADQTRAKQAAATRGEAAEGRVDATPLLGRRRGGRRGLRRPQGEADPQLVQPVRPRRAGHRRGRRRARLRRRGARRHGRPRGRAAGGAGHGARRTSSRCRPPTPPT